MARTVDTQADHIQGVIEQAGFHRGSAFVEVLQNCNIFNDGAHRDLHRPRGPRGPDARPRARQADDLRQEPGHGPPPRRRSARRSSSSASTASTEADILVHDETSEDPTIHNMLARIYWPEFPVPIGVIRNVPRPTHDELIEAQIREAVARQGAGDIADSSGVARPGPSGERRRDRRRAPAGDAPPSRRRGRGRPRRRPDLGDPPRRAAADARRDAASGPEPPAAFEAALAAGECVARRRRPDRPRLRRVVAMTRAGDGRRAARPLRRPARRPRPALGGPGRRRRARLRLSEAVRGRPRRAGGLAGGPGAGAGHPRRSRPRRPRGGSSRMSAPLVAGSEPADHPRSPLRRADRPRPGRRASSPASTPCSSASARTWSTLPATARCPSSA